MGVSCPLSGAIRKVLPIVMMTVMLIFSGKGKLFASDDWGYWNTVVLEHGINKKWEASLEAEQQFADFDDCMNHNYTAMVLYELNKTMQVGVNYKYEREEEDGGWVSEHRPGALAIMKGNYGGIKYKFTSLLEYREFEDEGDTWRLREKLKLCKPVTINNFAFTPFVSEEIYYDFEADELNQNRATVGVSRDLTETVELNLYYMMKCKKDDADDWPGENVLGTEFVISF